MLSVDWDPAVLLEGGVEAGVSSSWAIACCLYCDNDDDSNATPINSVLILGYHNLNNTQTTQMDAMDTSLFDKEMKYLHDTSVKVMTMSDLGYD